ncbi:polysaccharide biosynthesis/export family protein [Pedobacter sp. SYP-B3415]|uniref:polysaccharide biosynthesis/export family protein n=1 Tax=Pedobacter sp. SYP-B3415 TaxID=2496641 RepID=UPI001F0DEA20|nr:polysaccharide biosynthesis/export family protein [Pedobacter sp. SYP-B3415]
MLLAACGTSKHVPYFGDIKSRNSDQLDSIARFTKPVIQSDDILSVSIFTLNPATASVVNQAINLPTLGGGQNTALSAQATNGFLVDENGEIELTAIGKIKVSGLTTTEARELIREKAKKVFKEPNVQVRYANFIVTVLGEVNAPAAYTLPKEKVSILDAIGLAGDLTIYGKRDNILIVRDTEGKKEYARVNLNSSDIFKSPYFYLKQNDVIYVEPNKARTAANNANSLQTLGVVTSVLTVLVLIFTTLR